MSKQGYRMELLFSFYEILCAKTGKFYSLEDFSRIVLKKSDKASVLTRRSSPLIRDLHELWKLEHLISEIRPNKDLGFDSYSLGTDVNKIIQDIQFECTQLIRKEVLKQAHGFLSPVAVLMIWESLGALSEKGGLWDFKKLSSRLGKSEYYISKMLGEGFNPREIQNSRYNRSENF